MFWIELAWRMAVCAVVLLVCVGIFVALAMIRMARGRAPHFSVEQMIKATRDKH